MADVVPSRLDIEAAAEACKSDILGDLQTMTMKSVRGILEKHLDVPTGSLKAVKDVVAQVIDELLGRNREAIESTSPGEASQQGNDSEVAEEGGEDEGEDEEEASPQQKRKRKKASRDAEPKRKPKKKAAEVDTGKMAPNKKLEAMKAVCAKAGVRPPPSVYKGDDEDKIRALGQFMKGKGLSRHSTPSEIAAVKRSLDREMDLEGIDMSNIVNGGRRGRREAAAQPVNYKAMVASDSEADSEAASQESEDSQQADSGAPSEAPSRRNSDDGAASQGSDEDGDSAGGAAGPPATGSTAAKGAKAAAKGSTGKGTSANASKAASSEDGSGDDEGAAAETAEVPPSSALPAPKRRAVISDSDDK